MIDAGDVVERAAELGSRIALTVLVVAVFVLLGKLTSPLVRWLLSRRQRPSYTRVFTGLFRTAVLLVGILVALTLAFPSVRVADVLAIMGIVSVAAGFAFKDTFENLLAGVLLIVRDPFKSGDQVTVAKTSGVVEGVTVRETLLRGDDGRRYHVPNSKVMTDVIDVETDRPAIRQSFAVRLAATTDLGAAQRALADALAHAPGILADPPPHAVLTDVVEGDAVVSCRFWSSSRRGEATAARDAALAAVLRRQAEEGFETPSPEFRVSLVRRFAPDPPAPSM